MQGALRRGSAGASWCRGSCFGANKVHTSVTLLRHVTVLGTHSLATACPKRGWPWELGYPCSHVELPRCRPPVATYPGAVKPGIARGALATSIPVQVG